MEKAKAELAAAYRLFNCAADPQIIDESIHLIRAGEIHLDNILHRDGDGDSR